MPINYKTVGWTTQSYVNPTNMNQMDSGIKSACDGVDSLSAGKVDKVSGKQLSTEDYTSAEKTKLAGIATGATKTTIKNDLTTTTAGSALDASQGKVLADLISTVTADTSVHTASGTSLSLVTGKGGMRWQDEAVVGQTHKSSNLWDEQWEVGAIGIASGSMNNYTNCIRSKNFISCKGNTNLYLVCKSATNANFVGFVFYDESHNFISGVWSSNITTVSPANAKYFKLTTAQFASDSTYGGTYKDDIAVIEGTSGSYEPYGIHSAGDMGFFDGELLQGYWTNAHEFASHNNFVCSKNPIFVNDGDNIDITFSDSCDSMLVQWYKEDGTYISNATATSNHLNATAPADARYFYFRVGKTPINPSVFNAISITINGQYAIIVEEVGKNLAKFHPGRVNTSTGIIVNNDFTHLISDYIPIDFDNHNYTLRLYGATVNNFVVFYDKNFTPIGRTGVGSGNRSLKKQTTLSQLYSTLTIADAKYMIVDYYSVDDGAEIMVAEEGVNLDSYTPYSGKTYPIPLPHPARGIGDVREMVRKVGQQWVEDTKIIEIDLGEVTWVADSNNRLASVAIKDMVKPPSGYDTMPNAICSQLKIDTHNNVYRNVNDNSITIGVNGYIYAYASAYTGNPNAFKAAMSGVKLLCELATPTTEPLPNQAAMYELESYTQQTHVDTADGLATMAVEYGMSDLMATALNGERIGYKNAASV